MRRTIIAILSVSTLLVLVLVGREMAQPAKQNRPGRVADYVALNPTEGLTLPTMLGTDGQPFDAGRMRGRWSLLFFGFSNCPLVCPRTLTVLSALARERASGIASGDVVPFFISIDPQRDTPAQVGLYLGHFESHIVGLTGTPQAVADFSHAVGAGYRQAGKGFDHSTAIFVVDPRMRLVGILPHPGNAAQVLDDLNELRRSYDLRAGLRQ